MGAVVFIQQIEFGAGGSDVTPAALNWTDIATIGGVSGVGNNSANVQTIAGIDAPINLRASWTGSSGNPARMIVVKNGASITGAVYQTSPVEFSVVVGDQIYFSMEVAYTEPSGNFDTGTVTVINLSDGSTTLDTFAYSLNFVP